MAYPQETSYMVAMTEDEAERLSEGKEVFYFKGDTTIDGHNFSHSTIKVTGGNLTVHGHLGDDVDIVAYSGNVDLDSTGEDCRISAPRGKVGFDAIGCGNILKATEISGNYVEMGSKLKATKGDISIETGEHLVSLNAAGDVRFSELGNDGLVKAKGVVEYHKAGENTALDAPSVKQLSQTAPKVTIHTVEHRGRMGITRLCPLLYHDETLDVYHLNLFKHNRNIFDAYDQLRGAMEEASIKTLPGFHNIVSFELPKNAEKALLVQEAMDHFIAVTNKELTTSKSR